MADGMELAGWTGKQDLILFHVTHAGNCIWFDLEILKNTKKLVFVSLK